MYNQLLHQKTKKLEVLKHGLDLMNKKNDKNDVVLCDMHVNTKEVESELMKISNKTIVSYPCLQNKQKGETNIKTFIENGNHILVTPMKYFGGAEASNVMYIHRMNHFGYVSRLFEAVKISV